MTGYLKRLEINHVLLAGILLLLVAGNAAPVDDPDVWWHLKTGQDIVSSLQVPDRDVYSFSNTGHAWVAHEWLAEVMYFQAYRLAGYQGIFLLNLIILGSAFALLYRVVMHRSGGHTGITAVLLIAAAVLNAMFWMFRPHVPAYLFFIGYIYIFYSGRNPGKCLFLLPAIMVLWVNMHGSYIIGLGLAVIYLLSGLIRVRIGKMAYRPMTGGQIRVLGITTGVTFLAALINPNTYHIILYPFQTINAGMITSNVLEWLSPDFHQLRMKLFLVYFLFSFVIIALSPKRVYTDEMANLLVFGALSMFGARNLALFVFISLPVLARALSGLLTGKKAGKQTHIANAGIILVLTALIVGLWPAYRDIEDSAGKGEFPQGAVRYMEEHRLEGRVFNEYDWGGYLIWKRYPNNTVFVDGRADIYADKVIPDYLKIISAGEDSLSTLEAYKPDFLLMKKNQPVLQLLAGSEKWHKIYSDETAVLYGRIARDV